MKYLWRYIPVLLLLGACSRPNEDLLSHRLLADSLRTDSLMARLAEDSDITYAPVAVTTSSLVDASSLMTEDSTLWAVDTLQTDTVGMEHRTLMDKVLRWLTTPRDSLLRIPQERFALGGNFLVITDSLSMRQWPMTDEVPLNRGDEVVVAERMTVQTDSVSVEWVKLARDQYTLGWVPEDELPLHLLPDDSVSISIHFFSHTHGIVFAIVLGLFGLMIAGRALYRRRLQWDWLRHIDSAYSTVFTWLLATTAFHYALIQRFFPAVWEQYYYHPSFNPFDLAPVVSLFVLLLWATIWVGLSVVYELYHQPRIDLAFLYGLSLLSYGILLYILFTFFPFYLGVPAWIGYTAWSVRRLRHHLGYRYLCGRCGAKMSVKGRCPVCGTINE